MTCRIFTEADLPGVLRLWAAHSEWGGISGDTWRSWYRNTPHGDAIVIVAADATDDVFGQMVFTPSAVAVNGEVVSALRMSAPIIDESLRRVEFGRGHPMYGMYEAGVREGIRRGFKVLYSFANYKWLPIWLRWKSSGLLYGESFEREFGCVDLSVAGAQPAKSDLFVSRADTSAQEVADLWASSWARRETGCSIERTAAWIIYNRGDGWSFAARRAGDLVGYAVVRRNGMLADFFVRSRPDTASFLEGIVGALSSEAASTGIKRLMLMETEYLASVADRLSPAQVDFRFLFVGSVLPGLVSPAAANVDNWYLMPGD